MKRCLALLEASLLLLVAACTGPVYQVPEWSAPTATASPTATAALGWWSTVAVEMQTPLPTLTLPTQVSTLAPMAGQTLPTLPVVSGVPSLLATVTPVAYQELVGKILFRTTQEGFERIYVMDAGGGDRHPLYPREQDFLGQLGEALYGQALARQTLSSDGSHQVYVQEAWGRAQLYIKRLADGATWQLTRQGAGLAYDPAWQPGGDLIVFCSSESGNDEIWTIRADGSEARQLTHNSWQWDKYPSWSPDGGQIVFFSNRDGRRQLYLMQADGTGQRNISQCAHEDYDPVWVR